MKLHLKYNTRTSCRMILQEQFDKLDIPFSQTGTGGVIIEGEISARQLHKLESLLCRYGIEIVNDHRESIIEQIKHIINDLVYRNEKLPDTRISCYLARKLNLSYSYLSKIFSEVTHSSIENYLILQRIERAKQLIADERLTFTEVAWRMNYSSVAHLSNQFKKTTGLTPTIFQRIIEKRKSRLSSAGVKSW